MSRIILIIYFILVIGVYSVLAQEENTSKEAVIVGISKEEQLERYADEINQILNKIDIKDGYVQVDKNGKLSLEGTFRDYDEFLSAYMVAQAVAGVNNVNPAYNVVVARILKRPSEECLALAMVGLPRECKNYIDIQINPKIEASKEQDKVNKKNKEKGKVMGKTKKGMKDITLQGFLLKKEAIIIAVSQYKYNINPLGEAVINDAYLVKETLEKRGYKVTLLLNENATYNNTKKILSKAIERLKDGDTLLIYASTHGAPKSPNGDTGIVLYDTWVEKKTGGTTACQTLEKGLKNFEEPKKESKGYFLRSFLEFSKKTDKTKARDIIITASKMCMLLKNSLVLTEDVLPLIEASGKKIRLIINPDVCYSGGALKSVLGNVREEVYTYNENVAKNLVDLMSSPFIFMSASSENQPSMQKKFGEKHHGIFTYYYYIGLSKYIYDSFKTFTSQREIIRWESAKECRMLKGDRERGETICAEEGQRPLYINNSFSSNEL